MVRELIVEGLEAGSIVREGAGSWEAVAPLQATRLHDLLASRFEGLRSPARELLELVAAGEPLELDLLEDVDPRGDLDALRQRHLLTIRSEGRRVVVTTSHPLYGEMIRGWLTTRRRQQVATILAAGLTSTGLRRHGDGLRASHWQLIAGESLDPAVLLHGAAEALSVFDFPLAERLATAAAEHEAWTARPPCTCWVDRSSTRTASRKPSGCCPAPWPLPAPRSS
jgi:hypothetical protein